MNMRNLQRSGSQKREKRKMVRSVLTPGKLCSFGSESPKPFEFKRERAARSEIPEGNKSNSRLACSDPFSCASHRIYFFDKSNY